MNSCKFRFLGLVITTLFITGLIATPTEITTMKDASAVIKQSDLRTDKVGQVITASERSSALGINGGSLNAKEGEVVRMTSTKEGVVFNLNKTNAPFGINDREGHVIQNEGRPDCPDGTIADCSGDGDCCPESWIGDGFEDCEDQAFGCDLTCYDNDGGDCDAGGTTTTTTGAACDEVIWTTEMTFDWYCTGSPGSGNINFCANGTADLAGYTGTWMAGTGALPMGDGLCPGDAEFSSDLYFMFDNYATIYHWDTEGDDIYTPGVGYHDDMGYNGENNADGLTCINGGDCTNGTGTTTGGTTTGGDCPAGTVEDCSGDGDCCPESWIGDGFEDCEDQAFGCDLTCYDNDGGDCGDATGGTTGGTTGGNCPDGTVEDCSGDGDCCPESWIGDGFEDCEDQAFGCDLTCYDNDGGDCGGGGTTTTTTGGGNCDEVIWTTDMTFDWYCTGSPGSGTINFCANGTADLAGYTGTWTSGNGDVPNGDGLCPGTGTLESDLTFQFDNYATIYQWDTEGDDIYTPGAGYHDDQGYNGEGNADGLTCINGSDACLGGGTTGGTTTGGDCPAGTVEDCSGDGDCCPESWIGDGFEDCEDQAFGCDLTCYDNDGGDCGDATGGTTGGTTGGNCPDGTVEDCSGDGDCCPESWIGDGFEDCEDQAFGCDLTCYDNDGGDCGGGGTTTTTTTGGGDALASFTITFDWYCTGSPGSSTMDIYEDGTALLGGAYPGTWMADGGDMPLGDGLCPGTAFTNNLSFMFDNYATVYMWTMEDGTCSNSTDGYHDDTAYNGGGNADGLTSLVLLAGNCEDTDPCDGQEGGDANGDGAVNVLDVVSIVNYILAGGDGLDDCGAAVSDYNGDGAVNVLDVVAIVNMILAGGGRTADATNATMIQTVNGVDISADGYIGGVQMTLSHGVDFNIELTDNAYVAEYKTNGTSTMLIVINPEDEEIFRSSGDFTIDEVLVTNSQEFIDVAKELPVSFTLSNAYPNPFNPTTTLTLDIADQSFASVKVFNLRGEVVGVLMNDMVNAGSYTMTWDASNLSSGVYMIKAEANGQIASQKVMLVK